MDILNNMFSSGVTDINGVVPATTNKEIGSRNVLLKYTQQMTTNPSNVVKIDTAIIKIGKKINAIASPSLLASDRL